MDHNIWHPGVCALCNTTGIVAPFTVFDEEDAPYFYACGACYLAVVREDQRLTA